MGSNLHSPRESALNIGISAALDYPRGMKSISSFNLGTRKTLGAAIFAIAAALVANFMVAPAATSAVTQQVITFFMNGDCSDYFDEQGEYAFFEDEPNWTCSLVVKVKAITPKRVIHLQFWNSHKWIEESKTTTSTKGSGTLTFDPYCNDGNYCDGTWKYRVLVDASGIQKAKTSPTFEVVFYPGTVADSSGSGN